MNLNIDFDFLAMYVRTPISGVRLVSQRTICPELSEHNWECQLRNTALNRKLLINPQRPATRQFSSSPLLPQQRASAVLLFPFSTSVRPFSTNRDDERP